jgi:hypothetical protein
MGSSASVSDSGSQTDVLFVIDATSSMAGALKGAHDRAASIASDLREEHPDTDFRFGSVCFRDPVDCSCDCHEVCQFTPDINRLVAFFSSVQASGGGDAPEDWVGALSLALSKVSWSRGARILVFIADAPAHGRRFCGSVNHQREEGKLPPLVRKLAAQQIQVQALSLGPYPQQSFDECERIYTEASGPSWTTEQFSVGYATAAPVCRVDILGRNMDAPEYPKDYPDDPDYDSDSDTHELPSRRHRPPVIDDCSYAVGTVTVEDDGDVGGRIASATARAVAKALHTRIGG